MIIKVAVGTNPAVPPAGGHAQIQAVEAKLIDVFTQMLQKNLQDFFPYVFQILGLLLDATPSTREINPFF